MVTKIQLTHLSQDFFYDLDQETTLYINAPLLNVTCIIVYSNNSIMHYMQLNQTPIQPYPYSKYILYS